MRTVIRFIASMVVILSSGLLLAADDASRGDLHYFHAWHTLPSQSDKEWVYMGFVNGFIVGDRPTAYDKFAQCVDRNISAEQAVAMIDKYSTDNPQRWKIPLAVGMVEALTVKDGPCPNLNPIK